MGWRWSGGAAADGAGRGLRQLALVVLALESGGAGGAEREAAEAVEAAGSFPAAGAGAYGPGAWLAAGNSDRRGWLTGWFGGGGQAAADELGERDAEAFAAAARSSAR